MSSDVMPPPFAAQPAQAGGAFSSAPGESPTPPGATTVSAQALAASAPADSPPLPANLGTPSVAAAPLPAAARITLEAAVRRAVSWHPAMAEAAGYIGASAAQIDVAQSGYYPRVRGGIDAGYDNLDTDGWRPQFNVTATQMVYDFGKVSNSVAAATARTEASRGQLLVTTDALARDTAYAVIEVQRNRALRAVTDAQLAGVQAIAKLVQQRSERGASTRSDQVQAQARVEEAQSMVLQVSADYNRWQSTLGSLIGSAGPVTTTPDVPSWLSRTCDVGQPDWSKVPGIIEAEARRREAVALLARSRADIYPTLSLEAGAGYDFNDGVEGPGQSSDQTEFTVGFNLTGNIYEGGANLARERSASYALRAAEAARANVMVETSRQLSEARHQIGNLKRLLVSLAARSKMMNETRDLYRHQYLELGTRTLLDLLNAEQELHAAQMEGVNTEHNLRRLGIDCMFSVGTTRQYFGLPAPAPVAAPVPPLTAVGITPPTRQPSTSP